MSEQRDEKCWQCAWKEHQAQEQQAKEVMDALDHMVIRLLLLWPVFLACWVIRRLRKG
jgi:mannose/fructose/N-acetylgalactosamine-specific phosphotransferase system component IID